MRFAHHSFKDLFIWMFGGDQCQRSVVDKLERIFILIFPDRAHPHYAADNWKEMLVLKFTIGEFPLLLILTFLPPLIIAIAWIIETIATGLATIIKGAREAIGRAGAYAQNQATAVVRRVVGILTNSGVLDPSNWLRLLREHAPILFHPQTRANLLDLLIMFICGYTAHLPYAMPVAVALALCAWQLPGIWADLCVLIPRPYRKVFLIACVVLLYLIFIPTYTVPATPLATNVHFIYPNP